MLIKFNSADRAEKTVGSTGTILENLLRQVKEERDNTTQTHSLTKPLTHKNISTPSHPHTSSHTQEPFSRVQLFNNFAFKWKVNTSSVKGVFLHFKVFFLNDELG